VADPITVWSCRISFQGLCFERSSFRYIQGEGLHINPCGCHLSDVGETLCQVEAFDELLKRRNLVANDSSPVARRQARDILAKSGAKELPQHFQADTDPAARGHGGRSGE
jgi:hypothetical protein